MWGDVVETDLLLKWSRSRESSAAAAPRLAVPLPSANTRKLQVQSVTACSRKSSCSAALSSADTSVPRHATLFVAEKYAPNEAVDLSQSEESHKDDVTRAFIVKICGSVVKRLLLEWSLVLKLTCFLATPNWHQHFRVSSFHDDTSACVSMATVRPAQFCERDSQDQLDEVFKLWSEVEGQRPLKNRFRIYSSNICFST